ncbi:biotin/lipoyl-containing protein [Burkholderia ubonensis]|uniref:biotin/lipoyl-containing protein n=1 Tax=Burkholderia ubonensis TaxID=101571 RepID=UPI0035D4B0F7
MNNTRPKIIVEAKVPGIALFEGISVIEVHVREGDTVEAEQSLVTLESDKAVMDVPSPVAGVIKQLKVKVGDAVSEGVPILVLESAGATFEVVPVDPANEEAPKLVGQKPSDAPQKKPSEAKPTMNVREGLKKVGLIAGGFLLGPVVLVGIPFAIIFGVTWVIEKIGPWLVPTFYLTLGASAFILAPLALIPKTRTTSATGLMIASYIFGVILWIESFIATYEFWGTLGVLIGLFIAGVGIVPIAILATLIHADWMSLLGLTMLLAAVVGARFLAFWVGSKAI